MKEYLFEATDADGEAVKESLIAVDVADARLQLTRMGYRDIRVLTGELVGFNRPKNSESTEPAVFIDANYDSLPVAVLKIYKGNWIMWMPGVLITCYSWLSDESMLSGIAALVVGLVLVTLLSLPVVFYNQALWARVRGNYRLGLIYVALLRRLNLFGSISALILDSERAKMLAGMGRTAEALQEFSVHAGDRDKVGYLIQLVGIHDTAGDRETMIEVQRQLLKESKDNNEMKIDLAWSLVRYTPHLDEARRLVSDIHASNCAELYAAGLRIVHGLLAQADNQHDVAARTLRKVHDDLAHHANPLVIGMRTELRAYLALSLKALGRSSEADALWQEVLPMLKIHHYELLIGKYDAQRKRTG